MSSCLTELTATDRGYAAMASIVTLYWANIRLTWADRTDRGLRPIWQGLLEVVVGCSNGRRSTRLPKSAEVSVAFDALDELPDDYMKGFFDALRAGKGGVVEVCERAPNG